ncbi:MAG: hypothetical protein KGZ43_02105 [Sulfuritalea sp.]|nr:hypothetical protein [Sulfuritalea sp.]
MIRVASSIPGRLRLRLAVPRAAGLLPLLCRRVERWDAVQGVEVNPRTGSLLVRYDATRLTPARIEARLVAAGERALAGHAAKVGADPTATRPRGHGGTPRVRANRWAKRAMLVGLAASLSLAALGNKRWHWLTGVLFLHALAVHLWVHRRHLVR